MVTRFAQLDSLDDFTRLHDQLAAGVTQCLCEFYDILNSQSMFLGRDARARLPELGEQLASMYARLAAMSFERGLRLWKLTPKLHLFLHLCVDQAVVFGNPRFWWTYGDEDLVRIMINIADSVHSSTLAVSVLSKWLWCVFDEDLIRGHES